MNEAAQTKKPLWLIALTILIPASFSCLATSATNVAIPHIAGYFGSTVDEANWVITSYMIANACLILMTGWLENLMGRKLFLKIFISIFTIGSLMCAFAHSLNMMVIGRLIQGIGGGPMTPIAQSVLLSEFPFEKRSIAMSLFGMAVMVFAILGPTFGGFIVDNADWQWIYLINVPVGIISVAMAHSNIKELTTRKKITSIDFLGMISLVIWLLTMQVVLDKGQQYSWFDADWIRILSFISLSSLIFFIVWELEYKNPLVNLRVFKDKNFFAGTIISSSVNMIVFSSIVLIPQFLQNILGYTAMLSGMSLAPRIISSVIMIILINPLMKIFDNRKLIATGFFFLGISVLMYTNINLEVSFLYLSLPNILLGVGVIFVFVPVSSLVLGTLPKNELSNGASLHNLYKTVVTAGAASVANTLVARYSQAHQTYLVRHLSDFNLVFQNKLSSMIHTFSSTMGGYSAHIKANAYFYKSLTVQSKIMAYVDVFEILALIAFIMVPMSFILKTKVNKNES